MWRHEAPQIERPDQGQRQRQARRCVADLPVHLLRRHVEPAVLERQPVRSIDPPLLASLLANDATLARRLAFDGEALKRWAPRLRDASGAVVGREVLSGGTAQPGELRILCVVPYPLALRLDRLLADELRLSRSRIQALAGSGTLMAFPAASRILRRPVRDGMTVLIRLPIPDAEAMVDAAAGADACPIRGQA
jgi:hypothetical protein